MPSLLEQKFLSHNRTSNLVLCVSLYLHLMDQVRWELIMEPEAIREGKRLLIYGLYWKDGDFFEKAYPDKTIVDLWSVDTFFRPETIEFIRQKSEFTEAPTYSYQFTYEFPIDGGKAAWHCAEIPFVFHNIDRIAVCNVPGETDRLQERMATAWINFARYGSPETPSLPNWPACTPGDEATMIFDRTCEIRRNFDHELVKKLVETDYNPMTPVVEDEEEDAFFIH